MPTLDELVFGISDADAPELLVSGKAFLRNTVRTVRCGQCLIDLVGVVPPACPYEARACPFYATTEAPVP